MADVTRIWLRREATMPIFEELLRARGFRLVNDELRAHNTAAQRHFEGEGGGEVGLHEDHVLGVRHIWVRNAPGILSDIQTAMPHFTREELMDAASHAEPRTALSALRVLVAMESGALSSELAQLIARWMDHPNRIVRRAILHLCWSSASIELLPEIDNRSENDAELCEGFSSLAKALRKER